MPTKTILFFHPHTNIGGTEQNIIKISKALKDQGYAVHFCAFEDTNGPLYKQLEPFANSLTILSNITKSPVTCIKNYSKLLSEIKPDKIFNFGLRVDLFSRIFSKRYSRAKLISNIRSTDDWRKWYHTFLDKMTQSNISVWVANSEAGKNAFVQREGLEPAKVEVVYNFIDEKRYVYQTHEDNANKYLKIGVLANIRPAKGHNLLLEIAERLIEHKVSFKFLLAGKDLTGGELFRKIKERNLESYFDHRGFVSDINSFFAEIDISLLPSKWEGLPTSILEAMASGIPVIATTVGGIPEIISSGKNGILVGVDNSEEIVKGILKLNDKIERNQLALKAKDTIRIKFSKEPIMNQWVKIIES